MEPRQLILAAARNNAEWHAAVCSSHGLASRFTPAGWECDGEPPPYHGRFVGLTDDAAALEVAMARHRRTGVGEWGAKDSFGVLGAAPHRRKLFDAVWYARPPEPWAGAPATAATVRDTGELTAWVAAWGETPLDRPVVVPAILGAPGVTFRHDGAWRGGCVSNRSHGEPVVGVTNFFGNLAAIAACVSATIAENPACTVAGYGPGSEAESLAPLGFQVIGPLTVWLVSDHGKL